MPRQHGAWPLVATLERAAAGRWHALCSRAQRSRRSDRLHEVDGLRAFAMTGVIAQHCGLFPCGWAGVWLFFVISGYVITRGFLREPQPEGRTWTARYGRFMVRRAVRILPLYCGYVALGTTLQYATGEPARLSALPYLLSMTYNWHMIFGLAPGEEGFPAFGHLWTLSVEEQFYLVFPVLFLCLAPRLRLATTIALIAAGPVLRVLTAAVIRDVVPGDQAWLAFAVYASSPCHFDAFLIGSLIAYGEPRLRRSPRMAGLLWTCAGLAAAGYLIAYAIVNHLQGARGLSTIRNIYSGILYGAHREVFVYVAVDLLAAAVLVHALRRGFGSGVLGWWPVAWVGRISYGGYVYHALLLWLVHRATGTAPGAFSIAQRVLLLSSVWTATVAIAGLSFHRLEEPLARRFRQRRAPALPSSI